MKNRISLLLIVVLIAAAIGFSANAELFAFAESEFTYEACEGGCRITGYAGSDSVVSIPETIDGMAVVAIGERAFSENVVLAEVYLPSGVLTIEKSAFFHCAALESAVLNAGLESIGEWAFAKCNSLESIVIPETVLSIGDMVFAGCSALQSVVLDSPSTAYSDNMLTGSVSATIEKSWETGNEEAAAFTGEPVGADTYAGSYFIDCSSERQGNKFPVTAEMTVDGDLQTAWNTYEESRDAYIAFTMPYGEKCTLAGFRIVNGYAKSEKVYRQNSRAKALTLYCDGKRIYTFTLEDTLALQTFYLLEPVVGSEFEFVAEDVYAGSKYDDLCITEIELLGINNEDFDTGDLSGWGRAVEQMIEKIRTGGCLKKGDVGYAVMGLQVLLDRGFGLLEGNPDGSFGAGTVNAVTALMNAMRNSDVAAQLEEMRDGVADAAFLNSLLLFIQN